MKRRQPEPALIIPVPIYRLHVVVFIGWTAEQVMANGRRHGIDRDQWTPTWERSLRNATETAQGYCSNFGGNQNADIIIWLRDRPRRASEYGTLWHELVHAVDRIAEHCDPGNRFDDGCGHSEPRAFLYEYLAVRITQILWNKK